MHWKILQEQQPHLVVLLGIINSISTAVGQRPRPVRQGFNWPPPPPPPSTSCIPPKRTISRQVRQVQLPSATSRHIIMCTRRPETFSSSFSSFSPLLLLLPTDDRNITSKTKGKKTKTTERKRDSSINSKCFKRNRRLPFFFPLLNFYFYYFSLRWSFGAEGTSADPAIGFCRQPARHFHRQFHGWHFGTDWRRRKQDVAEQRRRPHPPARSSDGRCRPQNAPGPILLGRILCKDFFFFFFSVDNGEPSIFFIILHEAENAIRKRWWCCQGRAYLFMT